MTPQKNRERKNLKLTNEFITGRLNKKFQVLTDAAKRLKDSLEISSYADLGKQENQPLLQALEQEVCESFAHSINSPKNIKTLKSDKIGFITYETLRMYQLWPEMVGDPKELVSSLPLKTMLIYKPKRIKNLNRVCKEFAAKLGIDDATLIANSEALKTAKKRIQLRADLIDVLLHSFGIERQRKPSTQKIAALAKALIPDLPMAAFHIDIVSTKTMLFICLADKDRLKKDWDAGLIDQASYDAGVQFLDYIKRVNFDQFSKFPGLSRYDARDADPKLLSDLGKRFEVGPGFLCEWLSSVVMIEDSASIEKFLIHDTWGHLWQADLTGLKELYDRMVSLQMPVSPDHFVVVDTDNVISMVDLFYLRQDGEVIVWEDLAEKYGDALHREKIATLFGPLIAEMCADMIEYCFSFNHRKLGNILPSSSSFFYKSTKLDFAWADLYYFVKMLRKSNDAYIKNQSLFTNTAARILEIHKLRHSPSWANSNPEREVKFKSVVEKFLTDFIADQRDELSSDLRVDAEGGRPKINAFFQIYLNLIKIQATTNKLFHEEIELKRPHLLPYREFFILFIARFFCADPLRNFFELDELIANHSLTVLEAVHSLASS